MKRDEPHAMPLYENDAGPALVADLTALTTWIRQLALPVWSSLGQNSAGAFEERLGQDGRRIIDPRRARVQARQIYVLAEAGRCGWNGPWRPAVELGLKYLREAYLRSDGLLRTRVSSDGEALDDRSYVYDQAFYLLALASVSRAFDSKAFEADAVAVRERLWATSDAQGGIREAGDHPHQSNAHMHLLEASLAWEAVGGDAGWAALSDRIVRLARARFIDRPGGFLREFFASDWSPAHGSDGRLIEPGHQFEWAWLLVRYGQARRTADVIDDARRLYAFGVRGLDPTRNVVVDEMACDGGIRRWGARLWPQTEWLKASAILTSYCDGHEREQYMDHARRAIGSISAYLTPHGLWRDTMVGEGLFIEEPAPASSLYHIMASYLQAHETFKDLQQGHSLCFELY